MDRVLAAYEYEPGRVKAWCPICDAWHYHGTGKNQSWSMTHRVAHCPGSAGNGYYLLDMATITKEGP